MKLPLKVWLLFCLTTYPFFIFSQTDQIQKTNIQAILHGTVIDSITKAPLSAVTVQIVGTTHNVITDRSGRFEFVTGQKLPFEVKITSIGYKTLQKEITQDDEVIALSEIQNSLNDIVIVGYGREKKSQLLGSVSQLESKDINNRSVPQLSQALTGQLPGVTVIQSSGRPGASGGTIEIRGVGSFGASTTPLILVDGIPVNSLDNIDPNDVASVSVLKDASSAAIYGARAANGVILVTTKIGSADNNIHVRYNGYLSSQRATAYPDFVNSWQYATLMNEAVPGSYTDEQIQAFKSGSDPYNYPNNNWIDLVLKKSTLQTGQNISISNSTKNTDYSLSFGYLNEAGIVEKNNFDRYNIRLNMTNRLTDKLKLTSHLSAGQYIDHEPAPPATLDFNDMLGAISNVVRTPSIYVNKLSNGDWGRGEVGKGTPVSYLDNQSFYHDRQIDLLANERLDYNILKNLQVSLIGGYTQLDDNSQRFLANQVIDSALTLGPGNLTQGNSTDYYKTLQELVNYNISFSKHNFSILLGHSFEDSYSSSSSAYRSGYTDNSLTQLNAGDISTQSNSGTASEWALDSYFGRLQYNYANKYLIEGDVRRDGSSRFPTDKKYATFPAVAIGWRLSQEPFIKDNIGWINELKIKASYGILGNQNIGNYPYQNIFATGYNYPIGGNISTGVAVTTLTDSLLHWESTRSKDLGIEASVLNNKLSFSATYFNKYTYDILVSPASSVSQVLGFSVGEQNSGKLSNRGWEFTLEHKNKVGKISYDINANFSIINNKVLDLGVGNIKQPNGLVGNGSTLFVGYPMGVYYGYVADGLFTDQNDVNTYATQTAINPTAQPGDIRYKDISGPDGKPDGVVNATYDQKVLGSNIPKYTYGANFSISYKGIDLGVLLQGVADVKGELNDYAGWAFYNQGSIQKYQMDERWTQSNPRRNAKYPRLQVITNTGTPNTLSSSYWLINGSYLRIKNAQIGYTLPQNLLKKTGINSLRVYASAENFLTWSHYPQGWDPEINTGGSYYPILANYTFGLNVDF